MPLVAVTENASRRLHKPVPLPVMTLGVDGGFSVRDRVVVALLPQELTATTLMIPPVKDELNCKFSVLVP
jgi:hypothetical protein